MSNVQVLNLTSQSLTSIFDSKKPIRKHKYNQGYAMLLSLFLMRNE